MLRAGVFGTGTSPSGDARRTDFEGDLGIDLVLGRGVAGELAVAGLEGDDAREREVGGTSVVLTEGRVWDRGVDPCGIRDMLYCFSRKEVEKYGKVFSAKHQSYYIRDASNDYIRRNT